MQSGSGYTPIDEWNFAELNSDKQHAEYFRITIKVLELLEKVHELQKYEDKFEFEAISGFLKQLIISLKSLHLKYTYPSERRIWLDLSESGFPNQIEFAGLEKDITTAAERCAELPTASVIARSLLDTMMSQYKEPPELLKILCERTYLDYIQSERLFLPYCPGELHYLKTTPKGTLFAYPFACYDFASNRPYLHYMTLEKEDLDTEFSNSLEDKFLKAVKLEGGRAAPLAVMGSSLDESLDNLHPKSIRRLCLGPLYSRYMLDLWKANQADPCEMQIREIFSKLPESNDDFILFFSEELLYSKKQRVEQSGFLSMQQQTREIYEIDTLNPEAYDRKVSQLHYGVLLSHQLLQNLSVPDQAKLSHFNQAKKYVYNNEGVVYGI